jgi:hypothetical protein
MMHSQTRPPEIRPANPFPAAIAQGVGGRPAMQTTSANLAPFIKPTEPDPWPINLLHRGHNGYISFSRNHNQWQNLFSVRADELETLFPQFIQPHVDLDSYYSVNGYWRGGRTASQVEPSLRGAYRKAEGLRWLTSCFADLDVGRLGGVSVGTAFGAVIDMQQRGIIPPVSLVTLSGRGLWVYWILRSEDGGGPVRAWPENTGTYRRIQRELTRMFEGLEPDYGARDPSRVTRVPGSVNSKAAVRVSYWPQFNEQGQPYVYTLNDLAALVGVRPVKMTPTLAKAVDPRRRELGIRGHAALHRNRLAKLISLVQMRNPVKEGCRNRFALLLAFHMHRCRMDEAEIRTTLEQFGNRACSPPLTDSEISEAFEKRRNRWKFQDATIADWLRITAAESAEVGFPPMGAHSKEDDAPANRAEMRQNRRRVLRSWVESARTFPTLMDLRERLDEVGLPAATKTIRDDLIALGLINPRRRTGKRTAAKETPFLPVVDLHAS